MGRWWWLALPALAVAAYVSFTATLGLLGEDEAPMPPSLAVDARPADRQPGSEGDGRAAPMRSGDASPGSDLVPPPDATAAPVPSPTARAQRAAVTDPRPVKRAPAPKEDLTEQDRRALERILEQADKKAR